MRTLTRKDSIFSNEVLRAGKIIRALSFRPNLRTTVGIDWQSDLMGGGAVGSAGTATGIAATTLTDTGAAWGTTQWLGHIVAVTGSTAGTVYGVVISHIATVLTVDKWYTATDPGGAAAATPTGTIKYVILPGQAPTWWLALTENAATPLVGDTTLTGEITTQGMGRTKGTYAHTAGASSFTVSNTFTMTAGGSAQFQINKESMFIASNGGKMPFESAEPSPPTLVASDQLAQTCTVSI